MTMGNDKAREGSLWQWLSRARLAFRERLDIERIENMLGSGHPDVRGTLAGDNFYIELKSVPRPTRKTTIASTIRKEQAEWADRYIEAGGRAHYLLIQVGSGVGSAARYLIGAEHIRFLYENQVDEAWFIKHSYTRWNESAEAIINAAAEGAR
jgi:hypothetical protein